MDSGGGLRARGAARHGARTSNGEMNGGGGHAMSPQKTSKSSNSLVNMVALAFAVVGGIVLFVGITQLSAQLWPTMNPSHYDFPYTCTISRSPVYLSHHKHQVKHSNLVTFEFSMEDCDVPPPGIDLSNTVFQGNLRPFFRADGGDHWSLLDHVEEGGLSDYEYELANDLRFRRRDFHVAEKKKCGKRMAPVDDGRECVFVHFRMVSNTPPRPRGSSSRHQYS